MARLSRDSLAPAPQERCGRKRYKEHVPDERGNATGRLLWGATLSIAPAVRAMLLSGVAAFLASSMALPIPAGLAPALRSEP